MCEQPLGQTTMGLIYGGCTSWLLLSLILQPLHHLSAGTIYGRNLLTAWLMHFAVP
jgi:hypothetical protein